MSRYIMAKNSVIVTLILNTLLLKESLSDWIGPFNGKQYKFVHWHQNTWSSARYECMHTYHGQLASVLDRDINDKLVELLQGREAEWWTGGMFFHPDSDKGMYHDYQ